MGSSRKRIGEKLKKVFRFDDICINSNMTDAIRMAEEIKKITDSDVWFCVSPLVHNIVEKDPIDSQQVFPRILAAHSTHKVFYNVDRCGIPDFPEWITRAGHGTVHVDHRLLDYQAQELSIVTSCSLINASIFVPPFNKWNSITEQVCREHNIQLIKFEDGWLSAEHNIYNTKHDKWYLHHRAFTVAEFKEWIKNER